jgi:hypothetical protein
LDQLKKAIEAVAQTPNVLQAQFSSPQANEAVTTVYNIQQQNFHCEIHTTKIDSLAWLGKIMQRGNSQNNRPATSNRKILK